MRGRHQRKRIVRGKKIREEETGGITLTLF
jgi:hypothetical protein